MSPLEQEIHALAGRYYERFGAMDFAAMRELWDPAEAEPTYLAEEIGEFLHDFGAIEAYWAATRAGISRLASRHWNVRAHLIAPDLASATWHMHWNALIVGREKPVGGDVRVTATLRRVAQGWRLIHYVEAPMAPILYVQKLYEQQVDPDFHGDG
jgi:hypothetical protein